MPLRTSQTPFITLRGYYHDVIEQQVIHYENECGYNIAYAIVEISYSCNFNLSLKTYVIYKARGSHWLQQVSAVAKTR